jgi:hypothetical protein
MKLLLVSGHTSGYNSCKATGVNEGDLNIDLVKSLASRLEGYAEISVYPYDRDMYHDNKNGCLKVNLKDFNYIFEVHFNAFNNKAKGTEILIHSDYKGGISVEKNILAKMVLLGFQNRGIVYRNDLLNMKTCLDLGIDYALLETCFFDNVEDIKLYKSKKDKVADAVAKGIIEGFGLKKGLQAVVLKNLISEQVIAKVAPLYTETQKTSGILASIRLAQFILESGFVKSELGQNANNPHGMKTELSGNTWAGSVWDQKSVYEKPTAEWVNGQYINIIGKFRKYENLEDAVKDHAAYLSNAKDGNRLRYEGLKGCTDYRQAAQIIKDGGYATSPDYVEKLCKRVEGWNLTQYDLPVDTYPLMYRVQVGAYKHKENADAQLAKVKAAGFDAFIAKVDGLYKVQVGAYSKSENAEAQLKKVKKAGFSAFISVSRA